MSVDFDAAHRLCGVDEATKHLFEALFSDSTFRIGEDELRLIPLDIEYRTPGAQRDALLLEFQSIDVLAIDKQLGVALATEGFSGKR
jgi:hypothetical protein